MPVDLAQRLMYGEAVARGDLEVALLRYAKHGLPFLNALLELRPHLKEPLEAELTRIAGGEILEEQPDPELVARLPDGLCSQFLGFPIAVSSSTGMVDVLIADPVDAHASGEFSFHLQAPVRLVRGSLSFLMDQLVILEGKFAPLTARQDLARMNDAPQSAVAASDSAPPIPLVRLVPQIVTAPPSTEGPKTQPGVAPPAQEVRERLSESSEPDQGPLPLKQVAPGDSLPGEAQFQEALGDLAIADSPDAVVQALVSGLSPLCEEVVIMAVRGVTLRSRYRADRYGEPEKMTQTELPETAPSCASAALREGQFLGAPAPADSLVFAMPSDEVSATAVKLGNKPALVICISGFGDPDAATRRADHLARASSDALSRILLSRKR